MKNDDADAEFLFDFLKFMFTSNILLHWFAPKWLATGATILTLAAFVVGITAAFLLPEKNDALVKEDKSVLDTTRSPSIENSLDIEQVQSLTEKLIAEGFDELADLLKHAETAGRELDATLKDKFDTSEYTYARYQNISADVLETVLHSIDRHLELSRLRKFSGRTSDESKYVAALETSIRRATQELEMSRKAIAVLDTSSASLYSSLDEKTEDLRLLRLAAHRLDSSEIHENSTEIVIRKQV